MALLYYPAAVSRPTSELELKRLFPGESQLSRRMRELDWAETALGPAQEWPESLRVAVRLCLTSRIPIVMFWGASFTLLYNDAYVSFLGEAKHPRSLGRPAQESWSEIWETIGPMLQSVRESGTPTWSKDLRMFYARRLPLEEVFVRFTFGPILGSDGETVEGVFGPCTETTDQVLGNRRLETLRRLGVRPGEARTVEAACGKAAAALAENPYDIPFAAIYLVDAGGASARSAATAGLGDDACTLPEVVTLQTDGPWSRLLGDVLEERRPVAIPNLPALGCSVTRPWAEPAQVGLVLPIATASRDVLSGFLVIGVSPRLVLDGSYRTFFDLVAAHIGSAVADARAHQHERERSAGLAELNRARTRFFTNISHEFRTPLTLMLSPLEQLLGATRQLPNADRELLELVHRHGMRLLELVNALLDFSRIEAGRMQATFVRTDLAQLTRELASAFHSEVLGAGMRFELDCPPVDAAAWVDPNLWEKIVLNLIANAFQHTFEGEIVVRLRQVGEQLELTVRDTGVGIPPEHVPHVFERFHRVESTRRRTRSGTGIGLAVVAEMTALHGGQVHVDSTEGRGSTFTVTIPTGFAHLPPERLGRSPGPATAGSLRLQPWRHEPRRTHERAPEPVEAPESNRPRILLAEDNRDMRDYLLRLLQPGFEVEAVADGVAAMQAIGRQRPDLVLTDVMMPELDGFELLARIRADPHLRELPVVLLSARSGEEARIEGAEAGADDYLTKPFHARELIARIRSQVRLARERAAMTRTLRDSEERLRMALSAGRLGTWELELEPAVLACSAQCRAHFGRSPDEAFDLDAFQGAIHPGDRDELDAAFLRAREQASDFETDLRCVWPDASLHWIHLRGRAIPGPDGRAVRIVGVTLDISERKESEEALRSSEQRFRLTADAAPVMIWIAGADGRWSWFNKPWLEFVGRPMEQQLGRGWCENIHPDDAARCEQIHAKAFAARTPFSMEYRLRRHDGEYRWVLDHGTPLESPEGQFNGFIGSCLDITGRKLAEVALRESEERYRAIVESQSEMICRFRRDGTILFANGAYARARGVLPEELVGQNLWEFVADADRPVVEALLDRITAAAPEVRIENRFQSVDGERWMLWTNRGLRFDAEGRLLEAQAAGIDISRRRRMEEALKEANRRKDEFLATLAHELRNPLAPLRNGLELMRIASDDSATVAQARTMMERQLGQLVRLIDDLLDVSRISRGKIALRKEPVALAAVVQQALETSRPLLEAGRRELEVELPKEPLHVHADPTRLAQVFANLLNNAAKFTPERGHIRLTIARDGQQAVVSVMDDGVGIPPEMLQQIFEMFTQVDRSLERSEGGLGIGLSLVKGIVELHGGTVAAHSAGRGRGSEFVVRLPLVAGARSPEPHENGGSLRPDPCRILVVDDNRDAALSLAMLLQALGNETRIAHDGLTAIELAAQFRPRVVLLDIGMPELNGYDAARRIRAEPWGRDAVLVALTGWGQAEDRRRSREAGFDHHLVKPLEPSMLLAVLAGKQPRRDES